MAKSGAMQGREITQIAESSPNPVVWVDLDGRLLYANPSARAIDGLLHKRTGRLLPAALKSAVEGLGEVGGSTLVEFPLKEKILEFEIQSRDEIDRIILFGRDVSKRVAAEAEARLNRSILEDAFDNMSEGIAIYDEEHRLVRCNRRFKEFYQYTDEEAAPGTSFDRLIKYDLEKGVVVANRQTAHSALRVNLREKGAGSMDVQLADGRWLQIRDRRTSTGGTVTVQTDITELKAAQQSVVETEGLLSDAFANMSEAIAVFDAEDRLVYHNRKFREFYNYSEADVRPGVTFAELGDKDIEAGVVDHEGDEDTYLKKRFDHRKERKGSIDVRLADGRWLQIRDRSTAEGGIVSIQADITRRKEMEAEIIAAKQASDAEVVRQNALLSEREKQMRAIVEDQTEMISRIDADLNLTFANMAYRRTFLADPENDQIEGKNILELIVEEDARKNFVEGLSKLTPENPILQSELFEETADGTIQYQAWTDRAIFTDDNELLGYQSVGRDITSKKISEQALAASAQERQAIVSGSLDAIITFNGSGEIREFNAAAEQTFGIEREAVIGKPVGETVVPPQFRTHERLHLHNYLNRLADGDYIGRRIEAELMRSDGSLFPAEVAIVEAENAPVSFLPVTASAHGDGDPESRLLIAYVRDLTDRRKLEEETARQREAIAQSEKLGALGSLLANVAHELNNPLAVVIGQTDLLQELSEDEKMRKRAERIKAAANRCAGIVRTFLAAVRQREPEKKLFDAREPVAESLTLLEYAFTTGNIELIEKIAENLPGVFGDATQIGQVLTNILVNAQQALGHTDAPRKIAVSVQPAGDGKTIHYRISDSGPGIDEEIASKVFDPFYTTKEEGTGTGIGLSIANNIISAHGGQISISRDTELGGACFEIELPVADAGSAAADDGEMARQTGPVGKRKVLVVDDEVDVAETAADHLVILGYDCDIAANGRQALEMIAAGSYDAVISDLRMPEMDGPSLYRAAVEKWPGSERRFGFFTGDNLSADIGAFLKSPGILAIEKPFTAKDLGGLVESILDREE